MSKLPPIEIDAQKWREFCELWHMWNNHKTECRDAMLQTGAIFSREFRGFRKRRTLVRKSMRV